MEVLLGHYIPDIRIPYWDWANDHELPSWVNKPSGVTRGPDTKEHLANMIPVRGYAASPLVPYCIL
jgi:hypothetical protein